MIRTGDQSLHAARYPYSISIQLEVRTGEFILAGANHEQEILRWLHEYCREHKLYDSYPRVYDFTKSHHNDDVFLNVFFSDRDLALQCKLVFA